MTRTRLMLALLASVAILSPTASADLTDYVDLREDPIEDVEEIIEEVTEDVDFDLLCDESKEDCGGCSTGPSEESYTMRPGETIGVSIPWIGPDYYTICLM